MRPIHVADRQAGSGFKEAVRPADHCDRPHHLLRSVDASGRVADSVSRCDSPLLRTPLPNLPPPLPPLHPPPPPPPFGLATPIHATVTVKRAGHTDSGRIGQCVQGKRHHFLIGERTTLCRQFG